MWYSTYNRCFRHNSIKPQKVCTTLITNISSSDLLCKHDNKSYFQFWIAHSSEEMAEYYSINSQKDDFNLTELSTGWFFNLSELWWF